MLAERGAVVAIADVDKTRLDEALRSLPVTNKQHHSATIVDVRDSKQVEAWIQKIVSDNGALDGAANIAGTISGGDVPIYEETDEGWDRTMDVNAKGVFNCLRTQLRIMKEGGSIVSDAESRHARL